MNAKTCLILLLATAAAGCTIPASRGHDEIAGRGMSTALDPASPPSTAESQQLQALQQERQQLLATLHDFHERVRELESKLADREGKSIAKSYDELLRIKEAELSELRRAAAESGTLVAQRDAATGELGQLRQRLGALEQQVARKDHELASLRSLAVTAADLDTAKRRVLDLESQLMQRESETRALQKFAAEREGLVTQLQTATITLFHTKERLAGIEKHLAQKDQDLRTQATERQRLTTESASYAADLKLARQRVAALEQHLVERDQQLQILQRTGSDRERLASQLSVLNIHLAQTKQQASQFERQLAAKVQEVDMLRSLITEKDTLLGQMASPKAAARQSPTPKESAPSPRSRTAAFTQGTVQNGGTTSGQIQSSHQRMPSKPGEPQRVKLNQTKDELVRTFHEDMARGSVTIKQDGNQLLVSLSSSLLFPPGEVTLKPDGMLMLRRIGQLLAQAPDRAIQVAGHTDNQVISKDLRKAFPDNRALSWARADSARSALISGGTPPDQIRAIGLADKKPLASNTTEAGRQRNRRIEIIVTQFTTPSRTVNPASGGRGPRIAALSIPEHSD